MKLWIIQDRPVRLPAGYQVIEEWSETLQETYYLVLRLETRTFVGQGRKYGSYRRAVQAASRSAWMVNYNRICRAA